MKTVFKITNKEKTTKTVKCKHLSNSKDLSILTTGDNSTNDSSQKIKPRKVKAYNQLLLLRSIAIQNSLS